MMGAKFKELNLLGVLKELMQSEVGLFTIQPVKDF